MPSEEVRAVVTRFVNEFWNEGRLDIAEEILSPDVAYREPLQSVSGIEDYKQYVESVRATFPDVRITYDDLIVEGERAALRWKLQAAHQGTHPNVPIPPTGVQFSMSGQTVFRLEDGRIAEIWMETDYSPIFRTAAAFLVAALGALVGLVVLGGVVSKLLRRGSS